MLKTLVKSLADNTTANQEFSNWKKMLHIWLLVIVGFSYSLSTFAQAAGSSDPIQPAQDSIKVSTESVESAESALADRPRIFAPGRSLPPGLAEFLQPEDPPALIELELDDVRVDLLLFGSWKSQLALGFGVQFIPTESGGTITRNTPLPGLTSIPFTNTIDLLLSLWIDAEFFVEIQFRDGFNDNRFMVGFSALDPEFWLQKLWAGTHGIGIDQRPLLPSLAVRDGSPGIVTRMLSSVGEHQGYIRIETRDPQERLFLGNREITQNRIRPGAMVRGRHFLLPYRIPMNAVPTVEVWQETTADGPGAVLWDSWGNFPSGAADPPEISDFSRSSYFRRLTPGADYQLQGPSGALTLTRPSPGIVLVVLPESDSAPAETPGGQLVVPGSPGAEFLPSLNVLVSGSSADLPVRLGRDPVNFWVGDSGNDFETKVLEPLDSIENPENKLQVPGGLNRILFSPDSNSSLSSRTGVAIYDPGRFSPFEILGYYPGGPGMSPQPSAGNDGNQSGDQGQSSNLGTIIPGLYIPGPGSTRFIQSNTGNGDLDNLDILTVQDSAGLRIVAPGNSSAWALRWPLEAVVEGGSFEYFNPAESRGALVVPGILSSSQDTDPTIIRLGSGFNPGSIQVIRTSGVGSFTYDQETGILRLQPPPGSSELIRVLYSGNNPLGIDSAFSAGTQHRFVLADREGLSSSIELGIAGSIPLGVNDTWSDPLTEPGSQPRFAQGLVRFNLETPAGWFRTELTGRVQNPNPLGARHYLGSGSSLRSIILDSNRIGLAGVPRAEALANATSAILIEGTAAGIVPDVSRLNIGSLNNEPPENTRGALLYADSFPGSIADPLPLNANSASLPSASGLAIAQASLTPESGPYPVITSNGIGYRLDIQFDPGEHWAGFQMPILIQDNQIPHELIVGWKPTDGTTSIPILDNDDAGPNLHLFIQIGNLSEDTNQNSQIDGTVQTQPGVQLGRTPTQSQSWGRNWMREYLSGITFDWPREDMNNDGFLQTQDSAPLQTMYLGTINTGNPAGNNYRIPLDRAVANLIAQTASSPPDRSWRYSKATVRILVVEDVDPSDRDDVVGTSLLITQLQLTYPSLPLTQLSSQIELVTFPGITQGIEESTPPNPPSFYNEIPGGTGGRSIGQTLQWTVQSPAPEDELWTLGIPTPDLYQYKNLGILFYGTEGYDLTLTGRTLDEVLEINLNSLTFSDGWLFIDINLTSNTWKLYQTSGSNLRANQIANGTHSISSATQVLSITGIHRPPVSPETRTFILHKATGYDTITMVDGSITAEGRLEYKGDLLTLGRFSVLGNPWIQGRILVDSDAIDTQLSGRGGLGLLGFDLEAHGSFTPNRVQPIQRAGHTLRMARVIRGLTLTDSFNWSPGLTRSVWDHRITGSVTIPLAGRPIRSPDSTSSNQNSTPNQSQGSDPGDSFTDELTEEELREFFPELFQSNGNEDGSESDIPGSPDPQQPRITQQDNPIQRGPPGTIRSSGEAGVSQTALGLTRSLSGTLQINFPGTGQVLTNFRFNHSQTSGPELGIQSMDYSTDWAESFRFLDFAPGSPNDGRSYGTGIQLGFGSAQGTRTNIEWSFSAQSNPGIDSPFRYQSNQSLGITLGQNHNLSLNVEYRRQGEASSNRWDFVDGLTDLRTIGDLVYQQPLVAVSPLIIDLFYPWNLEDLLDQDLLTYTSRPQLSVTLRRRISGSLEDLYLPVFSRIQFGRSMESTRAEPRDLFVLGLVTGFTPINLFGTQGILPRASWFQSDQYTLDLGWQGLWPRIDYPSIHGITLSLSGTLFGVGIDQSTVSGRTTSGSGPRIIQVPGLSSRYTPNSLSLGLNMDGVIARFGGLQASLNGGFTWQSPLPETPDFFIQLTKDEPWQLLHSHGLNISTSLGPSQPNSRYPELQWYDSGSRVPTQGFLGSLNFTPWRINPGQFNLLLTHESILSLPHTGYVKGFISLGWNIQPGLGITQTRSIHHLGGIIGLELLLQL
jgi:hypothetical protein